MKASAKHIILDGIILFTVSTALVVLADKGFGQLKEKGVKDSAIVNAINSGRIETLKEVLAKNPESTRECDPHGRSPLSVAAYANIGGDKLLTELDARRAAMIPDLVAGGALVDHVDSDGWTPLMWASWSGLPKVAEALVGLNAKVACADRQGITALMLAARRGSDEIVDLLLMHGADKAAVNHDGMTALDMARMGSSETPERNKAFERIIASLE